MDLNQYKAKLVGDDEQRAVSPVIGVILMVAITVILAAVIAAFVLDLGGSVSQEAQAGVSIEVDEGNDEIQIEVKSIGNADHVNIAGTVRNESAVSDTHDMYMDGSNNEQWSFVSGHMNELGVGDVVTIRGDSSADVHMGSDAPDSGTVTAVAVIEEDDTTTQVASEDYDLDWS
ncbi:type IV pilin [Natrinema gari]|uniref:Archaeal Type IV pilin N-terminal domain-containing protein n=1 Tax=Natrinema gari JCM 14663 TaxID=1230459 RepID=L9ZG93_9EURY|nr:type IV pilin N-terminal domain-containing protein [Natrinema gari]ELY85051.1 hypothetical protein C486_00295 [Natrinema gari JCM 14663]